MGDANRRGTFEERKATSIVRQKAKAKEETVRKAEIEAAKTPEQRIRSRHAYLELLMILGMAGAYGPPFKHR